MAIIKSYRKQLIAKYRTKRDQALVVVGKQAVGFVKPLVPVDTGNLRSSITFATSKVKAKPTSENGFTASLDVAVEQPDDGHVVIGTNVHYAPHKEYGTTKMAATPFLRPGILNNKQILATTFAKMMKGL